MAAALGDLTAWRDILHHRLTVVEERLHSIEIKPQAAQPPPPPSTGPKVDRAELLHEINSGLRTLIAAVLVIAVLLGRVSGETIEAVRKAISIAP